MAKNPIPYTQNPRPYREGFTLVELLVSVGLFGIVVGLVTGIFTSALRNQRALVALMAVNDNVELALEQMAREIRTGFAFSVSNPDRIDFTNARGQSVAYIWDASRNTLLRGENGVVSPLTGSNVRVTQLQFLLNPAGGGATFPTRITVTIKVAPLLKAVEEIATRLQVSITPRS